MKRYRKVEVKLHTSLNLTLDRCEWPANLPSGKQPLVHTKIADCVGPRHNGKRKASAPTRKQTQAILAHAEGLINI